MPGYLATGSISTESVLYAIDQAKRNGMVPFVVVIPTTPEFIRDMAGDPADLLANLAGEKMRETVRSYLKDEA